MQLKRPNEGSEMGASYRNDHATVRSGELSEAGGDGD